MSSKKKSERPNPRQETPGAQSQSRGRDAAPDFILQESEPKPKPREYRRRLQMKKLILVQELVQRADDVLRDAAQKKEALEFPEVSPRVGAVETYANDKGALRNLLTTSLAFEDAANDAVDYLAVVLEWMDDFHDEITQLMSRRLGDDGVWVFGSASAEEEVPNA